MDVGTPADGVRRRDVGGRSDLGDDPRGPTRPWRARRPLPAGDRGAAGADSRVGAPGRWGPQLTRIAVQPLEWARTPSQFFEIVARGAPPGDYPRALSGQQSYWTVTGADSSPHEALLGEDGALEAGKAGFSVEPFVYAEGRLWTWHDVRAEQDLDGGDLPIPIVRWTAGALALEVTAFPIRDDAVLRATA